MSRIKVIVSDAEDSRALCRLCMIYHQYFVNIFIPNNIFRICDGEAIHDLLSLKVAVRDGLPGNICHQCVKKLMDFRDFKEMCLKTAAELRKCDLDIFLKVSKVKDEDSADVETSKEGSSRENTFLSNIQVTEVYITTPDELAIGNVSHAKEELWSTENALVVEEEVNDEEHRIEDDVPVNALTSVAIDPLAVDTMSLKEEAQEIKETAGEGNSLGDTSLYNNIQVTEVFLPVPDELAMGILVDCSNNIGGLTEEPDKELHKFGADRQEISQNQVLNNPSRDPVHEENLQLEYFKPNYFVVDCFPERRVKNQKNNVVFNASSKKFSQLNDRARPVRNQDREELCYQADYSSSHAEYICNYCNTRYLEKYSLALHIKIHVDGMRSASVLPKDFQLEVSQNMLVKAFKCNEFGKMFSRSCTLRRHSRIHSGVKPFKCNECGKMFTQSSSLNMHSVIHTGVKRFNCSECGKMFTQKSTLKSHSLIHIGVKPFKCNECGKMFTGRRTLKSHSRIHTGVKPFKCNDCGKIFFRSSHLNRHSVVHTGVKAFMCNDCGNMFTQKIHLKTHSVVHTGVKRFNCKECGKMFASNGNLKEHSVVHTGVNPFKCDVCGEQFKWRNSFNSHLLNHADWNPSK